jgi:hypothetical protein
MKCKKILNIAKLKADGYKMVVVYLVNRILYKSLVMDYLKQYNKLIRIHRLIEKHATGTSSQLAARIGLSRRMLFVYFRYLREIGAPLAYCRTRQTYFYETQWQGVHNKLTRFDIPPHTGLT